MLIIPRVNVSVQNCCFSFVILFDQPLINRSAMESEYSSVSG